MILPNNNLYRHNGLTCVAITATTGKYINQTKLDAPKCNKKSNFLDECSYFIVFLSSHKNHNIIDDL